MKRKMKFYDPVTHKVVKEMDSEDCGEVSIEKLAALGLTRQDYIANGKKFRVRQFSEMTEEEQKLFSEEEQLELKSLEETEKK